MYWWKGPDTLTICSTHLEKVWSTALMEVTDTIQYPKEEISKVIVDEYDETKTIIGIGVPVIIIAALIIGLASGDWMELK
jgi:carbohydrate-binding DOMON domain-containing protein